MAKFDLTIIGSSPLLLIKALIEANKGKKVCLLEKENDMGGVWKCFYYKGAWYEGACHILDQNESTYKIFKSYNIETEKVGYKIYHSYKRRIYDMSNIFQNSLLYSRVLKKNIFKKVYFFFHKLLYSRVFKNKKFYFFKYGSKDMLDNLISQCYFNKNISINLNTEVIKVKPYKTFLKCYCNNNKDYTSKNVYHSRGSSLICKGNEITFKLIIHCLLSEKIGNQYKYLKIIDGKSIERISIVGNVDSKKLIILESKSLIIKNFKKSLIEIELLNEFIDISKIKKENIKIINIKFLNIPSTQNLEINRYKLNKDSEKIINSKTLTSKHLIEVEKI